MTIFTAFFRSRLRMAKRGENVMQQKFKGLKNRLKEKIFTKDFQLLILALEFLVLETCSLSVSVWLAEPGQHAALR